MISAPYFRTVPVEESWQVFGRRDGFTTKLVIAIELLFLAECILGSISFFMIVTHRNMQY